ncbi:MAG: hypothetical protein JW940_00645 [Polyangiaceae bacterium]|nr:hypothetical protein [Polyangiaceae bacterium]
MVDRRRSSLARNGGPFLVGVLPALGTAGFLASCSRPPGATGTPTGPTAHAAAPGANGTAKPQSAVADVLLLRTVHEADFTELTAVGVDGQGAVIVGGGLNVERPGEHSAFVRKLDAGGDPVWTTLLNGHAGVTGLVVDADGSVWVSGWFRDKLEAAPHAAVSRGTGRDGFVVKLSPAGVVLSLARYGDGSYYAATAIALDRSGRPIVFGACQRDRSSDLCLGRFDGAGRLADTSLMYVRGGTPGDLAMDPTGSMVFAGHAPAQNADGSSFGGHHPPRPGVRIGQCIRRVCARGGGGQNGPSRSVGAPSTVGPCGRAQAAGHSRPSSSRHEPLQGGGRSGRSSRQRSNWSTDQLSPLV